MNENRNAICIVDVRNGDLLFHPDLSSLISDLPVFSVEKQNQTLYNYQVINAASTSSLFLVQAKRICVICTCMIER